MVFFQLSSSPEEFRYTEVETAKGTIEVQTFKQYHYIHQVLQSTCLALQRAYLSIYLLCLKPISILLEFPIPCMKGLK